MSSYCLVILVVLLLSAHSTGDEDNSRVISALWLGPGQHQIVEGVHEDAALIGTFRDDIKQGLGQCLI